MVKVSAEGGWVGLGGGGGGGGKDENHDNLSLWCELG